MSHGLHPVTRAHVNIATLNNETFEDAFQFGTPGDTTWSFTGQHFRADIKSDPASATVLLTCSTANGRIVVDDAVQRVLHFNVDDVTLAAALIPGRYFYDLVMFDGSVPSVRVVLMGGELLVKNGITGN